MSKSYDPLKVIFDEWPSEEENFEKGDVVLQHLHSSFALHASNSNPLSVHLIAMAATEILAYVARKRKITLAHRIPGLSEKEANSARKEANFVFNFVKHARNDAEDLLSVKARNVFYANEFTLYSACMNYIQLYNSTDKAIKIFLGYFELRFRTHLDEESLFLIEKTESDGPAISEEERRAVFRSLLRKETSIYSELLRG